MITVTKTTIKYFKCQGQLQTIGIPSALRLQLSNLTQVFHGTSSPAPKHQGLFQHTEGVPAGVCVCGGVRILMASPAAAIHLQPTHVTISPYQSPPPPNP